MRSFSLLLASFLLLCLSLSIENPVSAHGGVEKIIDTTIVSLKQEPLSPLVGESVKFSFVILDQTKGPLKNIPITLSVTDTYPGDESKDRKIYEKPMMTDVNGDIDFSYKFPKENYYDIDLSFMDATGKKQETGFLVQPRSTPFPYLIFGIGMAISIFIGTILLRLLHVNYWKHT